MIPSISIFVRHSEDCKYRGDENCRRCDCPKHLRWSHQGKQYRRAAKTRWWTEAENKRRELEQQFQAGGAPTSVVRDESPTLESAIKIFMTSLRQSNKQTEEVRGKYERELERLLSFCERHGRYFPADLTTQLMLQYRETWPEHYKSAMTQKFVQSRIKRFLRFCHGEGWMVRLPQLESIHAEPEEANPLEPVQFEAALKAIPKGEKAARVRGVMLLMRHSGLAVADATTLERSKIHKKNGRYIVETRRRKTGTAVSVPIPPKVAEEILATPNDNPKYLFWDGTTYWRNAVTIMSGNITAVFRKAFGEDTEFTSHNLRDTAGCEWLKAGIPLEIVSEMLGHKSIVTTERHYKKLVESLRDKHAAVVAAIWETAHV
jgi:integrase/recombinase XerD